MKRAPLILAVILLSLMFFISIPFLICVWLLGADKPFDKYATMLSDIAFNEFS